MQRYTARRGKCSMHGDNGLIGDYHAFQIAPFPHIPPRRLGAIRAFLILRFYSLYQCNNSMVYKTCQAPGSPPEISYSIYYAMIRSFCTTPCSVSWYCTNGLSSLLFF